MDITLQIDPTRGMSYDDILQYGRLAKAAGFNGLLRSDHYQLTEDAVLASTDAWTTLAGLVRDLDMEFLGTLVSPMLFRHPSLLAKQVATVAGMSKGARVELGIGTGNHEWEHRSYGFGFPTAPERVAGLRDYVSIVRALLQEQEVSINGQHYQVDRCRAVPGAPDVKIIIGSTSTGTEILRVAAEFADEINIGLLDLPAVKQRVAEGHTHLREFGRDADEFVFSWGGTYLLGVDAHELRDRADALRRKTSTARAYGVADCGSADEVLERLRAFAIIGTPEEAHAQIENYRAAGIGRLILSDLFGDETHMALLARLARAI